MTDMLGFLLPVALAAVTIVLLLGLWNMMRGGNARLSQTLMRWRVILQFAAILLVIAIMYLVGR
ncbi:MAG: twin transmembrane helix small protein [Fimbriimonadaceae bacterium]|nr:twin transmembrane helix small protein [Alphaproteobacteria bacterium]